MTEYIGKVKNPKSEMKDKNQNIRVFVRVRPVINIERAAAKTTLAVDCPTSREVVVRERPNDKSTKTFSFDKVFGPASQQVQVYKSVVTPLIDEVLAGYNCTVFAYGQTGTGKTFTMEGERSPDPNISWTEDPLIGIVPRSLSHLFDELRLLQAEHIVRVSFLELYNEELYDLLSPNEDNSKIRLYEDPLKKGSVIIQGLEELTVHDKNEVHDILQKGSLKRRTASTLMNAQSSRSHTIFSITVHIKESSVDGEELMKTGKLNLVDLAGSENIGRSGAQDRRAREAGNINQSLLTLGRVITALVERAPHIPYRESKLTRLLQDSLGGRTKTSIIATISPTTSNVEETLSTLDYAHRAKNITNRPEINQKLSKKTLLKEYTEEIDRLKRDLQATREKNGVFMDHETFMKMEANNVNQDREIAESIVQIRLLKDEMEKKEELFQQVSADLHVAQTTLASTRNQLQDTCQDRDEQAHLVRKHAATEQVLSSQAQSLLTVADLSTSDVGALHAKLDRKRFVDMKNDTVSKMFQEEFKHGLSSMEVRLGQFAADLVKFCSGQRAILGEGRDQQCRAQDTLRNHMSSMVEMQTSTINNLEQVLKKQMEQFDQSKEQHLVAARGAANSEQAFLQRFLAEEFLPSMQALNEQQRLVQELWRSEQQDRTQQVEQVMEVVKTSEAELREAITALRDNFEEMSRTHQAELAKSSDMFVAHQQDEAALDQKIDSLCELLQTQCRVRAAKSTKRFDEFSLSLHQASDMADEGLAMTRKFHERADVVVGTLASGLARKEVMDRDLAAHSEKMEPLLSGGMLELSKVEESVRGLVEHHAGSVEAGFSCTEQTMHRQHGDLSAGLEAGLGHTGDLTTSLGEWARAGEVLREAQHQEAEAAVERCQHKLDLEVGHIVEWDDAMRGEMVHRAAQVDSFLECQLSQDVPTGSTPQRREFHYPRMLAATSPHTRILQRFRLKRAADNDSQVSPLEFAEVMPLPDGPSNPVQSSSMVLERSKSTNDIQSAFESSQGNKENAIGTRQGPNRNGTEKYSTQKAKSSNLLTTQNR